jgi:hypothetical protein
MLSGMQDQECVKNGNRQNTIRWVNIPVGTIDLENLGPTNL